MTKVKYGGTHEQYELGLVSSCKCYLNIEKSPFRRLAYSGAPIMNDYTWHPF